MEQYAGEIKYIKNPPKNQGGYAPVRKNMPAKIQVLTGYHMSYG